MIDLDQRDVLTTSEWRGLPDEAALWLVRLPIDSDDHIFLASTLQSLMTRLVMSVWRSLKAFFTELSVMNLLVFLMWRSFYLMDKKA